MTSDAKTGALPRTPGYLEPPEMGERAAAARMIHPGPRLAERVQVVRTRLVPISGVLRAGETVMGGVARLFADAACPGGVVFLDGVICDPLRYVLPALSRDPSHAAWYSDTFSPVGEGRIDTATASVGQRDGAAFLHCHGTWATSEGTAMGHLLPFDSVVATDVSVTGIGALDGWFDARPDPETNFTLFQPSGRPSGGIPEGRGLIARIAPGEDVVAAIEALCADAGLTHARVHGLGSIDHVVFQDGGRVHCLATELRFAGARVAGGRAHLPIDVVDIDGTIFHGGLARGSNPVGVTLELLIEPFEDTA